MKKEVKKFAKDHKLNKAEAEAIAKEFLHAAQKEKKAVMEHLRKEAGIVGKKFKTRMASVVSAPGKSAKGKHKKNCKCKDCKC